MNIGIDSYCFFCTFVSLVILWLQQKQLKDWVIDQLEFQRQEMIRVANSLTRIQQQRAASFRNNYSKEIDGLLSQHRVRAKSTEMIADRAFNMASSANIALMHLQKTLQTRPYTSRKKMVENEKIQKDVMQTLGGSIDESMLDFLYPTLSDEEREIIDNAREHHAKYKSSSNEQ